MKPEIPAGAEFTTKEVQLETGYLSYKNLGGLINETDYVSALARQKENGSADASSVSQSVTMAKHAGIEIDPVTAKDDPRVILYHILRNDKKPEGAEYHHSQMSDQELFAEALRMSGDEESLSKLTAALPNIFGASKE